MPVLSDYVAGTITLTNGLSAFTGTGTGWLSAGFREGDTIFDVTGATEYTGVIASISGEGAGTLTKAWEGPTVTAAYRMRYQADGSRATAQARAIAEQFAVVEANGRGLFFRFSDSVADADPGPGYLRLNSADPAAATAIYIDNLDASGATVSGEMDTWDDGGSTIKGRLWLRSIVTGSAFRSYNVTGSVIDGTGYRKLTLAHVDGSGAFTADDGLMAFFVPKGDAGEDGLSAYQVALANGFVGSEAAWLGSLEGGDGINGVDGKFSGTEIIKTTAYTALAADSGKTIILNKATTDTLSFDPAATLGSTWMAMVKNIGAGTWTLDPNGAETIDGAATVTLAQNESVVVSCNGTALRTLFRGSAPAAAGRELLTADRTYYVRPDGSDSNPGLANTSGGAKLTLQGALNAVATLDRSNYNVVVQVADGTYSGAISVTAPFLGSGSVTVQGNSGAPTNVLLNVSGSDSITAAGGAVLNLKDFELRSASGFYSLLAKENGVIRHSNLVFGSGGFAQLRAETGGIIDALSNYAIVGGAERHVYAALTGIVRCNNRTITLTGTPGFSQSFAGAITGGMIAMAGNTFSGSATGKRYDASLNGVINSGGAGPTGLPGDATGTAATGGQYG